ncbi:pyridoxamine 5'-phosphate oxidase family protein [Paenibacillus lutrae]|uniref:Flavin-nucleotide-binding protein n=1 Tax=Paenibacillus lutrae TaxID=2078573 RepID=A0A7X3K088_9BACL|nr:pyridoxamine 5'-phosphate oxidase family protein [Paenibacillus lutrae]MVP00832.1 flavin-nucleotide-binding protein [Paenibacillus lutrae]
MRRKEFAMEEWHEIESFLSEMTFGVLGTVGEDGYPNLKPLNFVYTDGALYAHGSKIGEKIADMKRDSLVSFSVAKEYALIPSYFTDPVYACPASAFFKSVIIKGRATLVEDLEEKARSFVSFMHKLQPEGGYDPVTLDDPGYVKQIKGVAVIRIDPDDISAKFKFGQNMKGAKREGVISGLEKRGLELDEEALRLMKAYCPHHKED